jgi:hypothetical protein
VATIFQRAQDEFLYSPDQPGSTANWMVIDTEDPTEVATLIANNVPAALVNGLDHFRHRVLEDFGSVVDGFAANADGFADLVAGVALQSFR